MRDRREIAGWLLVGASLVYLWMFMPRGWVPHDEGTLGQSAEHILLGHLPHVDYQEPYTGGLSLLHAAVFKVFGVDLVYLRWVLFAAFAAVQLLIYVILRRFLEPIGAALVAMLSLTWSFPNYFASLPSWWVLLCAIVCVWAFIRYTETGSLRFAAAAGPACRSRSSRRACTFSWRSSWRFCTGGGTVWFASRPRWEASAWRSRF